MPFDTFDRGAYPAALGTSTSGDTWEVIRGGFSVSDAGGSLDSFAEGSGLNRNVATFDYGSADATLYVHLEERAGDGNQGIAFRVVDADNFYFLGEGSIVAFIAGVQTTIASGIANGYDGQGVVCERLVLSGSSIKVYFNCALVFDGSDSSLSGTKHGIYTRFASGHIYDFGIACSCGQGWKVNAV